MYEKLECELILRLSKNQLSQIIRIAKFFDITEGEVIRYALQEYFNLNHNLFTAVSAESSQSKEEFELDEQAIAECSATIKEVLPRSKSWSELQKNFAEFGLEYFERGGGLAIRWKYDQRYVCKASQAGPGYSALIKRFRAPFPGHAHSWLAERILSSD